MKLKRLNSLEGEDCTERVRLSGWSCTRFGQWTVARTCSYGWLANLSSLFWYTVNAAVNWMAVDRCPIKNWQNTPLDDDDCLCHCSSVIYMLYTTGSMWHVNPATYAPLEFSLIFVHMDHDCLLHNVKWSGNEWIQVSVECHAVAEYNLSLAVAIRVKKRSIAVAGRWSRKLRFTAGVYVPHSLISLDSPSIGLINLVTSIALLS